MRRGDEYPSDLCPFSYPVSFVIFFSFYFFFSFFSSLLSLTSCPSPSGFSVWTDFFSVFFDCYRLLSILVIIFYYIVLCVCVCVFTILYLPLFFSHFCHWFLTSICIYMVSFTIFFLSTDIPITSLLLHFYQSSFSPSCSHTPKPHTHNHLLGTQQPRTRHHAAALCYPCRDTAGKTQHLQLKEKKTLLGYCTTTLRRLKCSLFREPTLSSSASIV